jgi:hypothetical protein
MWTLQHGEITQSLADWGISNEVVTLNSFAPSTLTFDVAGDFDAEPLFANAAQVTLRDPDDVVRFVGKRRKAPQRIAGTDEARSYYFEDVLGDLNRRVFRPNWEMYNGTATVAVPNSLASLFAGEGNGVSAQITAILAAAASAGISVQIGSSAGITAIPRTTDIESVTYLEAIRTAARFAPDLGTWVDYTTSPPTVHFVRRSSATAHTLAVINAADVFELQPLHEQLVPAVVINYEKLVYVSGVPLNGSYMDIAPSGATGNEENALVIHTELKPTIIGGASPTPPALTQSQSIATSAITPNSFTFWEQLWPDLADRNEAATLTDGDESIPGMRRITDGAQPGWTGSAAEVLVQAVFNGVVNGKTYINKLLQAKVNASSLSTGTYTRNGTTFGGGGGSSDPGEYAPIGIAALLYSALGVLQWSGSHTSTEEADWSIKPSNVVSFTGTAESAHATANAQVSSVTIQPSAGVRTIAFGQSPVLPFDDLIELLRSQRTLRVETRAEEATGEGAEAGALSVAGSGMGPGGGLLPTPDPATHPFKVSMIGTTGNLYRVEAGTVSGYTVIAQTVNIGSSRPRGIRVAVKFTTQVSRAQYVYNATLRTSSGNAPVLEVVGSADCLDVGQLDSSGNDGRCLIAIVETTGAVSQIATGNILCTVQDDLTLAGTGFVTFNKSA